MAIVIVRPTFVLKGLKTALKCQKQEIGKEN